MIKSKLLASTMLVAASTMLAAGSADAAQLKLGGFFEQWVGYADNDKAGGAQGNFDVKQDSEINFQAEETLDNGMKVGVLFEFEAGNGAAAGAEGSGNSTTGFDETFAWVKASWGQLNIGNNDVASAYVGGVSTVGPVGITKSDANDWFAGAAGELLDTDGDVGVGDAQNITYFTPRVGGFTAIVSYTPDSSDTATSAFDNQETTGTHNAFSGALKYSGKWGKTGLGLNIGYTHAELTDAAVGVSDATAEALVAAGSLDFGAFKITAAFAKENADADLDQFYAAGVVYKMDKVSTVSLAYAKGEETQKGVGVADESTKIITLGYARNMGKGVSFEGSLFKVSNTQATAAESNDGIGLVGGLKIKF
jgi:outer membrane protein OmpU